MDEKQFTNIVSNNIAKYRKINNLTQAQLAQKLNYSDKSVSKWERGDGLPDAYMLHTMAELFGITLNEITSEKSEVNRLHKSKKTKHIVITLLSICLVWLVTAAGYFALTIINVTSFNAPMLFIYAMPASFIVLVIFASLWWKNFLRLIAVSGLTWTLALCIDLSFDNTRAVWIIAGVFQIMAVLWFYFRSKAVKNKTS